ncbi:AraC family transcriptional regulator [Saccharothrix sp. 6-C]|uniref:AraC family transcriptional regulator n=1 Tax=Saccharothrix sp. 6-C TaxID=2781735 RepID=UPI001916EBE8|nr:AraC family transcriptional regulator [Saccharothrix sp. 6-C]QQQ74620.1 AraC family transcriptional regulator [Saccharothrix sp. 6-C]
MGGVQWTRYWRAADEPVEAMHAHFTSHRYHRHSHDAYSFGVTEQGVQAFRCRGGAHTSAAGEVLAFNPDEAHDGRTATEDGFTYRIVHIGPSLVAELLPRLPLFRDPVVHSPALADALRRLHTVLQDGHLARDEHLMRAVLAMASHVVPLPTTTGPRGDPSAARDLIEAHHADDVTTEELTRATGLSRFALYRAFRAEYGLSPSDYQRQRRLRAARRLLADGRPAAEAAALAGFADQAHLTRWFRRCYGITPAVYARSVS